jgi:hypothetical protein
VTGFASLFNVEERKTKSWLCSTWTTILWPLPTWRHTIHRVVLFAKYFLVHKSSNICLMDYINPKWKEQKLFSFWIVGVIASLKALIFETFNINSQHIRKKASWSRGHHKLLRTQGNGKLDNVPGHSSILINPNIQCSCDFWGKNVNELTFITLAVWTKNKNTVSLYQRWRLRTQAMEFSLVYQRCTGCFSNSSV